MRLLGSSAKKGGYEDLAAASGEARLRRAKPAPSVSGDIAEAADKVGSDRKGRKGRRDKGDRIKPNQTKSNLRGSWRVPKLDNPMGRESAEGSLVKRSQTRSNSIQPNSPRSSPVKPSQTQSNSIRRGQTESNRIKPNQTESNRIKPNQTESNQIKPNQTCGDGGGGQNWIEVRFALGVSRNFASCLIATVCMYSFARIWSGKLLRVAFLPLFSLIGGARNCQRLPALQV
jgi:hypothetical protein